MSTDPFAVFREPITYPAGTYEVNGFSHARSILTHCAHRDVPATVTDDDGFEFVGKVEQWDEHGNMFRIGGQAVRPREVATITI